MCRFALCWLLAVPATGFAQSPETVAFVTALQDPATGGFKVTADGKPGLRACNGGVKALHYLGAELPHKDKTAAFVLACYDPATGAFAEPGGKPDVTIASIGVMVAGELGIPHAKMPKAVEYLRANAKTFEDVRIAAAAVEAWGVKECGFDLAPWAKIATAELAAIDEKLPASDRARRPTGSAAAMLLRLGLDLPDRADHLKTLRGGQRPDGGWGKPGAKASDIETTYRVMRAFHLLKEQPADVAAARKFVTAHRNADGGAAVKPGDPSTMSGVYYVAVIEKWLSVSNEKR